MIAGLALLALVYVAGFASGRMALHVLSREHRPRLTRLLPEPKIPTPGYLGGWPRAPRPRQHDGSHCRDCGRSVQACAVTWGLNPDDPQRCEYITMRRAMGDELAVEPDDKSLPITRQAYFEADPRR